MARRDIEPGMGVLDVACGTGNLAIPAARAGAVVTGVDIAANLIEQARARAAREQLEIRFDEGDAENLPCVDGSVCAGALPVRWANGGCPRPRSTERADAAPSAALHRAEAEELSAVPETLSWTVVAVAAGLLLLVAGSQVLLRGAVGTAAHFGVSEAVIGLTLVAVGTSLPELSVSVVAALRDHADVAVGNILGSNIFNLLGILGVSALLQPLPVHPRVLQFDQWVMLGTALLLLLCLYTGRRLSRLEGGVFLAGYAAYIGLTFTVFAG